MKLNPNWHVNFLETYWDIPVSSLKKNDNPLDRLKWVNSCFVDWVVADEFVEPWLVSFNGSEFSTLTQKDIDKKLDWVRSMFSDNTEKVIGNNANLL